ncbi:hypothetical protein CB1_000391007 [Camelus ferus]|nr:hypothetical protein CB1_000391007 [Camelus ferus]
MKLVEVVLPSDLFNLLLRVVVPRATWTRHTGPERSRLEPQQSSHTLTKAFKKMPGLFLKERLLLMVICLLLCNGMSRSCHWKACQLWQTGSSVLDDILLSFFLKKELNKLKNKWEQGKVKPSLAMPPLSCLQDRQDKNKELWKLNEQNLEGDDDGTLKPYPLTAIHYGCSL